MQLLASNATMFLRSRDRRTAVEEYYRGKMLLHKGGVDTIPIASDSLPVLTILHFAFEKKITAGAFNNH